MSKRFEVEVVRKYTDTFRVDAVSATEAAGKVYAALQQDENGNGVDVVNTSHTLLKQEIRYPRKAVEAQPPLPGTA